MAAFDTRAYCVDNKVASFSLRITYDEASHKKQCEAVTWGKINKDNFTKFHDSKKTGFAILTGTINNIVVLDCDINKAAGTFPQDVLDTLDECCKSIVKTPNGKHYYFSTNKVIKKRTGTFWKGTKVPFLDVLAEKCIIYAPPSLYIRGDEPVRYQWIRGDLSTLVDLPDSILDAIAEPEHTASVDAALTTSIDLLLDSLSVERWSDYEEWILIGMALYNAGYTVDLWDKYSKKATNYNPAACAQKWRSFGGKKTNGVGLGTLYYKLKQDAPDVFNQLRANIEDTHLRCASMTHQNTATLFYLANPSRYIYSPQLGWFSLGENNIWVASEEQPEQLMLRISNVVSDFCDAAKEYFLERIKKEEDDERKNILKGCMLTTINHKKHVQNTGYVRSTIEWIKELYTDSSFYKKINANRNLLAFTDAVFDFSTGEFRPIEPTDYISVCCPFPAPSLSAPTDKRLLTFLESIFENEDDLNYLLQILASSLDGFNRFQEFYIFKGAGGNGKGLLLNLLSNCLGDYAKVLPISYFTQKTEGKGAALPELANCASARFISGSEPELNDKLQVGFIKQISGDETLEVRKLYGRPFSYKPQFTTFILCNGAKLSKPDVGVQRRLRVLNFPFQFKQEQEFNSQNPEHRRANPDIAGLLTTPEICQSFLALLLTTYKKYSLFIAKTIHRPVNVLEATSDFLDENNPVASWLYEKYDTKADAKKKVSPTDLLNHYKQDTGKDCNPNQFSTYLSLLGLVQKKTKTARYYFGIERKAEFLEA